jgi:hypothetical protein
MTIHIGRRGFIATLGGAATWPFVAHAQQPNAACAGISDDMIVQISLRRRASATA